MLAKGGRGNRERRSEKRLTHRNLSPSFGSARRQKRVERALALPDLLQPWIAEAAVPIELHRTVKVAGLDQQLDGRTVSCRRLDCLLQRVGVKAAAVHGQDLVAHRHAAVERRA